METKALREGRGAAKYRVENGGSLFSNGAYGDVASLGVAFQRIGYRHEPERDFLFSPATSALGFRRAADQGPEKAHWRHSGRPHKKRGYII